MPETGPTTARRLVRLIVASPDRTRVLARPAGLAGWRLPTVAVDGERRDDDDWTADEVLRAGAAAGGPIEPHAPVAADGWEFRPAGRLRSVGSTWIGVAEAGRLGADAALVRAWAESP